MLKNFLADLHIHTCLSPCADMDMSPRRIIDKAVETGLDIIAVTDHNSGENIEVTARLAEARGITFLSGLEITSYEEVHILALFKDTVNALQMQDIVYRSLPAGENDERLYGHQLVVNEADEILGFNRRLLITATSMNASNIVNTIRSLGGLSIASHIDRETFSVISQLGFIPEDLSFDALEISTLMTKERAAGIFQGLNRFPWVSFSDAHRIEDIGKRSTIFRMRERSFEGIEQALKDREDIVWC